MHDKDAMIAAGMIPAIVALLKSDQPRVQEEAALALGNISRESQHNKAVIAAGAVPLLAALLHSAQPALKTAATDALHDIFGASHSM